ncbi:hypothetical protein B0H11DRAFT_2254552 [Mycena galericulata]|nr:hypothetical protein B0H11DRAFT_2254552 [Mycena galericulata]
MGRFSKRQKLARSAREAAGAQFDLDEDKSSDSSDDDTSIPPSVTVPSTSKPKTLKAQILEKDDRITELETAISDLQTELLHLRTDHHRLQLDHDALLRSQTVITLANKSLKSLKRKAETTFTEELQSKQKRIKCLEREREVKEGNNAATVSSLHYTLEANTVRIAKLEVNLASASTQLQSRDITILSLRTALQEKQRSLTCVRHRLYASQKQVKRIKETLQEVNTAYDNGSRWKADRCSVGKVEFAVISCAEAFGIEIQWNKFMSRHTLAREILEAPGFIESSDGTTHRGITVESRHVTLLVPSYDPDANDSDQSTWKHRTRFLEVAPALDHTAQRQFEGTMEAAHRIADVYNRSPLADQEKRRMEKNDYWRKKLGESKDHAADGKKEFKLSEARKKDIVIRDMGITDEDLQAAGEVSESELSAMTTEQRSELVEQVLERRIGEEKFDALTPADQCNACTHVFGGCCCHKDLNVVRYGVAEIQQVYAIYDLPTPVLLANKANAATINLSASDPDNPALQNAIDSSSSGAIKLLQLIGSLLRHKDGQRGYQDKCCIFMQERKSELFNLDEPGTFPDVSNTRYGCYTYAAGDVLCFNGLIQELVEEVMDVKAKSGQPNHVEANILKGMNDPATMAQVAAIALYGVTVSWPYMAMVCGTKENPVNLVSLTPLHRKLPEFCTYISENPHILLDPTTPLDRLTIDGKPLLDNLLLPSIRLIFRDLPNPLLIISRMFAGCAAGWIQFTPEFVVGGTFDQLTPEQLAILHIPATNDCSEGMLGSFRVHMRYHPNSTAHSFSNQTRTERNNTEAFIKKCCDVSVEKYVMREVRKDGASGRRAKFRRAWAALQREKAEKARERREKASAKKKSKAARLASTVLEFDTGKIDLMTSGVLKEQLAVYRDILKDDTLVKLRWKDMSTVAVRRKLVLEAREREIARRRDSLGPSNDTPATTGDMIIEEYGYSDGDDAEWEDVSE